MFMGFEIREFHGAFSLEKTPMELEVYMHTYRESALAT